MFFQNGEGREKFKKFEILRLQVIGFCEMQLCRNAKVQVSVIHYFMAGSTANMSQPQRLC